MLKLIDKVRNFGRREDGTVIIEALIVIPVLAAIILSMIVFFDAFRLKSVNLKAAYTVSDMVSRQTPSVDADFIAGLKTTYDFLVSSGHPTSLRISLVQFDTGDTTDPGNAGDDSYILQWSHGIGEFSDLTDATLNEIESQIPIMGHGDSLLIVQTKMHYEPPFRVGISAYNITNFIATRPRFIPPCWENCLGG